MFVVVGIWFAVYYWLNPRLDNPDAKACITGSCGDTMEIRLQFEKNKVVKTSHWTSGCAYSFNCVLAAADIAKGKSPEEILDIDADMIQKSVGGLPEDHIHCASLAAQTLHAAIDDYMKKT
ncbi:Iron-sulfur cluster assembly protein domain-containing protein [Desulfonema magnum]|uniref:Iron-sulfur cluster assembly protein domain-containing protein n=2 Tax=Desulfonema magnum TaxID=45655 RepID=A0A975GN81_9BACT|nr:Iron-sulfur cluster assembly protein domain-containing protein [Desulfonema magnum]